MKYLPAISSVFCTVSVVISAGVLLEARDIAEHNERRSLIEQAVSNASQQPSSQSSEYAAYRQAYGQAPSALSTGSSDPQVIYTADAEAPPSATEGTGLDLIGISGVVPDSSGVNIGVQGQVSSTETGASGVLAQSLGASGTTFGLIATAQSPAGAAAWLGGIGGADILNTLGNVVTIDTNGNVDANSYAGDGSALTGVTVGDGAVTTIKLADGAVTTDKIGVAAVTATNIAIGAVSSGRILDSGIANIDLADGSVRSDSIQDGSITLDDMGNNSVSGDKILDGTISGNDLAGKSMLYENTDSIFLLGTACNIFEALTTACTDANDIPLFGHCSSPSNELMDLRATKTDNWTNAAQPAAFSCRFCNLSPGGTDTGTAHITCIAVD